MRKRAVQIGTHMYEKWKVVQQRSPDHDLYLWPVHIDLGTHCCSGRARSSLLARLESTRSIHGRHSAIQEGLSDIHVGHSRRINSDDCPCYVEVACAAAPQRSKRRRACRTEIRGRRTGKGFRPTGASATRPLRIELLSRAEFA